MNRSNDRTMNFKRVSGLRLEFLDCITRSFIIVTSSLPHVHRRPWTVGRLLQWTADYLKDHGSDSPRLDAEVLLAEALGCQRIELYTTFDGDAGRRRPGGVSRVGSPSGRRARRWPIWWAGGVLLAFVPRYARRADSPAGNRVAGRGGARSGQGMGQGGSARQQERGERERGENPRSPESLIPHSPTSARAAALSPSAWRNTCRRAA